MELIVLHAISLPDGVFGTGHVIDLFMGRLDPGLHPSYRELASMRVSAHFFIERDGKLHQFVDTEDTAWHAGESCFMGRRNCNDFSIGIELEGDRRHEFTAEQYRVLALLCCAIKELYPAVGNDRIVGHSDVSPGRKWDPGPRFDWDHLRLAMAGSCGGKYDRKKGRPRPPSSFPHTRGRDGRVSPGQLLLVGFRPEERDLVCSLLREGRLGGVILLGRNCGDAMAVARLCGDLRLSAQGRGSLALPLVAVDQEQGRVCRIQQGVTTFPGADVLGGLDRPKTTERVAHWVGRELAALGVHVNLAPVADVFGRKEGSSVLAARCFGWDPALVARHVRAWIRGSQGAEVASCAKHFPGHGGAREDSHERLPVDHSPLSMMEAVHLRPFSAAIAAGVASIMVGHVAFKALDPGMPASLSSKVIKGLLREKMAFEGLVMTDDLEMGAVASMADPVNATVQALKAGADMALVARSSSNSVSLEELVCGIEGAMHRGRLERGRILESLSRVLGFKRRWIPHRWSPPSSPPASQVAARLARRLGGH